MAAAEQFITENLDIWTSAVQAKSAAGRGKANKLELYGIKKLRELILELAVRGLLVPQDPNDEPASELLKKIAAEKAQLVKDKKIKKQKALPAIEEDEKPFDLADGWEWARLGDIASVVRGVTYKKADASDVEISGTVPLMRANNIGRGLNFEKLIYVPASVVKPDQLIIGGDVLIAMSSGSADLVGKAAQASDDLHKTFGAFCGVIRSISSELFPYFDFYFQTPLYRNQTRESGKGIGIQNLNQGALSSLLVPVPPSKEREMMAAKVDELMALCDQLEQQQETSIAAHQTLVQTLLGALTTASERDGFTAAWARIADHFDTLFTTEWSIDQLKQTILQLAVMGKLVPQDPSDEPAGELLKKIAAEKAQLVKDGKIKKKKALPPIKKGEEFIQLPKGWESARILDFSVVGTGATPSRDEVSYYEPQDFNWVTSGETSSDFIFETKEFISTKAVEETNVSIYPVGTLIVAMYGQGKTRGQITELMIEAGTNQACAAIELLENASHHRGYIKLFFKKAYEELRSLAKGGAQPNLNVGKISQTVALSASINETLSLNNLL